jgi:hypothetical protein
MEKEPIKTDEWWERESYWKCLCEAIEKKDGKKIFETVKTIADKSRGGAIQEIAEMVRKEYEHNIKGEKSPMQHGWNLGLKQVLSKLKSMDK